MGVLQGNRAPPCSQSLLTTPVPVRQLQSPCQLLTCVSVCTWIILMRRKRKDILMDIWDM